MSKPDLSGVSNLQLPPIPNDFPILQLKEMLSHDSSEAYRYKISLMFRVLISFLDEHGLTRRILLEPKAALGDEFALLAGDLTPEGLNFCRLAEQPWMKAHDRGVSVTDTGILIRVLRKLRDR